MAKVPSLSGQIREYFPDRKLRPSTVRVKGVDFQVRRIEVATATYRKLGINPQYFIPGIKVYLMDRTNYSRFCQLAGLDADEIGGFYPLARGDEELLATMGYLFKLSNRSRVVVLPSDFMGTSLLHELAHDILFNGSLPMDERFGMVRLILSEARRALNTAPDSKEAKFVREVAESCQQKYNVDPLRDLTVIPSILTREEMVFGSEMFAYAVEKKVTGETNLGQIPRELDAYLERIGILA
jgi:hypothetical protein